uniref:Putative secreted protein n=1 Tax=Anopheles marajoara TaxID=58244 RepID=A0A2M4C878_9DIPT
MNKSMFFFRLTFLWLCFVACKPHRPPNDSNLIAVDLPNSQRREGFRTDPWARDRFRSDLLAAAGNLLPPIARRQSLYVALFSPPTMIVVAAQAAQVAAAAATAGL